MNAEEKAVCERLLAAVDAYSNGFEKSLKPIDQARDKLRALLDRPVAQPMTEDQIRQCCTRLSMRSTGEQMSVALARAVEAHHHIGEKS